MRYFFLFFLLVSSLLTAASPEERAHNASRTMFALLPDQNISQDELFSLAFAIETDLKKLTTKKRSFRRIVNGRTIEYDAATRQFFIHLGEDGAALIEQGYYKRVTKSILYHEAHPELVANCQGSLADLPDLKMTARLQGLPGIVEARALIEHHHGHHPGVELILKHYNANSLRTIFNTLSYSFSEKEKMKIAHDILKGLTSIHSKGFVHRDLHSGNYLVEVLGEGMQRKVSAVITDFGKAKRARHCRGISAQAALEYRSPESVVHKGLAHDDYYSTDLYAVGCVFYKLYFGESPPWFQNSSFFQRKGPGAKKERRMAIVRHYTEKRRERLQHKVVRKLASKKERFEYMILSMIHQRPKMRKSARYWRDFIR